MQQGNYQIQKQQQVQTLSPQQVLVVKMLELPAVELEERVRCRGIRQSRTGRRTD